MISKNADILKRHRILLLHLILLLNIYMYKKQKMFPLGHRIRSNDAPVVLRCSSDRGLTLYRLLFSFLLYFLPFYLFYYSFI